MRTKGVGLDNRTNDDYFKAQINYDIFGVGNIFAEYRYERIRDDIRDQYVKVETSQNKDLYNLSFGAVYGRYSRVLYYDELEYKNSRVNKLFLDSKIRAIPSITIENSVKFEKNDQIKGVMYDKTYQRKNEITTLAMVNKLTYTKRFGNWIASPGLCFRFYKKGHSKDFRPRDYYLMRIPIIMLKYVVSPNTSFMLGFQGIPGFEYKYNDYVQSENDNKRKVYILQIENNTTYFGYNIWASTGVRFDEIEYAGKYRQFEEYKTSTFFVRIVLGW